MKRILLSSDVHVESGVAGRRPISELAAEPSLFSCSMEHAFAKAGPITGDILSRVLFNYEHQMREAYAAGLHEVIDVRVQRLMPGMYPSILGWHCDAVPRPNYFAQPDFDLINPASFHVTCLVDTSTEAQTHGIAPTQILRAPFEFAYDDSQPVWQQLHNQLEEADFSWPTWQILHARPGAFVRFTSLTPHRATPCAHRGWRLFFRMSMYHNPPVVNQIQNAQQVYILSEANGW